MSDDSEVMAKGKIFIETFSAVCIHFSLDLDIQRDGKAKVMSHMSQ